MRWSTAPPGSKSAIIYRILKSHGCFTEIIQYRTRLFMPVDRAAGILDLIDADER